MVEIAVEGFLDKPDGASTTSSSEKNLSDHETRYDEHGKVIPDIIRPLNYQPDYNFQSNKPKEDDIMINTTEEEEKKVKTPTRISHLIGKRGLVRNAFGIKEFGQGGILGKVKGKVQGLGQPQIAGEGQGSNKILPGNFLDGSIKEALTVWILSKGGVGVIQSSEKDKKQDKSRKDDQIAVVHHEDKYTSSEISLIM